LQNDNAVPARAFDLDCAGRQGNFVDAKGNPDPGALLAYGMKGKSFDTPPEDALATLDGWLTSRYGLRKPLTIMPEGQGRAAARLVAYLEINNYVIAAQMAGGAAAKTRAIDPERMHALAHFVSVAVSPDDEDPELSEIAGKLERAGRLLQRMPTRLRAAGTWIARGYAFDDNVAIDASMAAFCMAHPSPAEVLQLREVVLAARLFRPKDAGPATMAPAK
jgi:hypothetical protein